MVTSDHRLIIAIAALLLLVACGGGGGGSPMQPSPTATLRGVVHVIPTGPPIDGVTVTVQGRNTTTNAQGNFTLTGLAAGETEVTLARAGYARTVLRLTLNSGDNFFSLGMSPE